MNTTPAKTPVEALRKGLGILELIAAHAPLHGMPLSEIAHHAGLKPTTVHNLLKTLRLCGYLRQTPDSRYALGWKLFSLSRAGIRMIVPGGATVRLLEAVANELQEALVLATLVNGRRRVAARVNVRRSVTVDIDDVGGDTRPFWGMVTSRVLAAWCPPPELTAIIVREGLPGERWAGIRTQRTLKTALADIRKQGFSEDIEAEVASLAVPVLAPATAGLLAALGSFLPSYRYTDNHRDRLLRGLRDAASRLVPILEEELAAVRDRTGSEARTA